MKHKLIVALDNLSEKQAKEIIKKVSEECNEYIGRVVFKVNDLLALKGLEGIKAMTEGTGARLMLDPKWHDIPNTMRNYFKQLLESGLGEDSEYVTIHASNGFEGCKAAVDAKEEFGLDTKILAVTVLTSLEEQGAQVVFNETAKQAVLKLAGEALKAGVDGIVCSPLEVEVLREVYGEEFILVNPGVRFEDGNHHDQKRVLTPSLTIEGGSTDAVMGRNILDYRDVENLDIESIPEAVNRFFKEIEGIEYKGNQGNYEFERLLQGSDWKELLKYIGAFYFRSEGGKYCRLASGLISNAYINIGTTERNYLVMDKAAGEAASQIRDMEIEADVVMGAQMGSVRSSMVLAKKLGVEESVYTEKSGDDNEKMELKRHNINLKGKKVVISEDIITGGSTLAKMKAMVEEVGGEVVAIVCVGNRYGKNDFEGVPLISCYVPEKFEMYWDEDTITKTETNMKEAGKSESEIQVRISEIQENNPRIPKGAEISQKPKNQWDDLVESMRK